MRALVLGGSGMLGHRLWLELRGRGETYVTLRQPFADYAGLGLFEEARTIDRFDACDEEAVVRALQRSRPEVVFNVVAVLKQRPEGRDPVLNLKVNALLPHLLARRCAAAGVRLIHISTDGVFSGRRGAYTEADVPDAEDSYGRAKLLGELDGPGTLTLRTCIVGRELATRHGLLEWFLAQRGRRVQGYAHALLNGFTTPALAAILADIAYEHGSLGGVWHLGGEAISKLELLRLANEVYEAGVEIEADAALRCDRTLDASRLRARIGFVPQPWQRMLADLRADALPYDAWALSRA
jgi:dTDP-4-dehydrorhamnose reductase